MKKDENRGWYWVGSAVSAICIILAFVMGDPPLGGIGVLLGALSVAGFFYGDKLA